MSQATADLTQRLYDLQQKFSLSSNESLIKSYPSQFGNIEIHWINNRVEAFISTSSGSRSIAIHDVVDLPKECMTSKERLSSYLSQARVRATSYDNNQEFKLTFSLSLLGGGNIGVNIQKWPVLKIDGSYKIIVPYLYKPLNTDLEAIARQSSQGGRITSEQEHLKLALAKKFGDTPKLIKTLKKIKAKQNAIELAIDKWNETDLVQFISIEEYTDKFAKAPVRWVDFKTSNPEGECFSKCIGMCPSSGPHIISCDIEGKFHSSPVQSMMHEIGHALGLRHEFARADRAQYVNTTFNEDDEDPCLAVGEYDLNSIMHYELGIFDEEGKEYLQLSESFKNRLYTTFPDEAEELIDKLEANIGKQIKISNGDIAAIKELYKNEILLARQNNGRQTLPVRAMMTDLHISHSLSALSSSRTLAAYSQRQVTPCVPSEARGSLTPRYKFEK